MIVGKMITAALTYYAPAPDPNQKTETVVQAEGCTRSSLFAGFILLDLAIFGVVFAYFALKCEHHYGAATCAYSSDRSYKNSIINVPGLKWVECYDTAGAVLDTNLSAAQADAADEETAYSNQLVCGGGPDYDLSDDYSHILYSGKYCCDGYYENDDCVPEAHCYNILLMCEWKTCPDILVTIGLSNGVFSGLHAVLLLLIGWSMNKVYMTQQRTEPAEQQPVQASKPTEVQKIHPDR